MKEYVVVFEKGETSWGAYVPDIPGCVAAANTKEEVLLLIREALLEHISLLKERGMAIPEPTSDTTRISVAA